MANTIRIKRKTTTGAPANGDLVEGELAINTFDQKLYSKDATTIFEIAPEYSHPTHPGDDAAVDTGPLTGANVISDLDFNITTDTLGHVTDANATVATRAMSINDLGGPYTNNAGTVTSVGTNTGLSGTVTTSGNLSLDLPSLALGGTLLGTDWLIASNGGVQNRQVISSIPLSIFNNNSGWTSNAGTVTAVNNGNGMNFTNITGSGTVTMGTPSSLTGSTTNATTASSHTHAVNINTSATTFTGGEAPIRHASGYLYANYFNQSITSTTGSVPTHIPVTTSSDGFFRHTTLAQFRTNVISGTTIAGDVTGTIGATVVGNDSHTHAFNNLTGKTGGTGNYQTSGDITADNFEATGLGPTTTPGASDLYMGGYGIIGDRSAATVYVTNANSNTSSNVALATGGSHSSANIRLKVWEENVTGRTSSGQVNDHGGTLRDIGFNVLPNFNFNASDTLEASHCGHATGKTNTSLYTLTGPTSSDVDFPVGGVTHVYNLGTSGNYLISDTGTCTMYVCDGSAAPQDIVGTCTLAPGGMATLWRYSTTAIYITGTGITV